MEFKEFEKIFCDILPVLFKAAPTIGTFIGTPATFLIVGLLATLVHQNACEPKAIADALKNDPDLFAKLNMLERTHGSWLDNLS
jgi:hypothetical protein